MTRNIIDDETAERNRTTGRLGSYTFHALIPLGTVGVGFVVAALRLGDHAHLDVFSGFLHDDRLEQRADVSRGDAGRLIVRWNEWLVLREILEASDRVHIVEVERPTRGQLEYHTNVVRGR